MVGCQPLRGVNLNMFPCTERCCRELLWESVGRSMHGADLPNGLDSLCSGSVQEFMGRVESAGETTLSLSLPLPLLYNLITDSL